jgi:hypothetical protein
MEKPTALSRDRWSLIDEHLERFLLREPLQTLHADVLHSYLNSCEGREHLPYFLPRLLEVAAWGTLQADLALDAAEALRPTLSPARTRALDQFLSAWWAWALDRAEHPTLWTMAQLFGHSPDPGAWLQVWSENTSLNATLKLAETLRWELPSRATPRLAALRRWLTKPHVEHRLEAAFFADPDGPHATELSDALTLWRGWVLGIWGSDPPD